MTTGVDLERLFGLRGLTAVVTGASSGLGERFARVLDGAGARVVLTARRKDLLDAVAADLTRPLVVAADLSSPEDRERLVATTIEELGAPHILVNNAGVGHQVALADESVSLFRNAMEINVTAPWHLTKLFSGAMAENGGGTVVNIGSIYGLVASTPVKQTHYCASKGALVNLTRELAVQLARRGVRVNCLCPGFFPSEMHADMDQDAGSSNYVRSMCPMARTGRVDELDSALLFLAGSGSSYMTGQCLVVDGGWTAR